MSPIVTFKSRHQWINDSKNVTDRAAKEQAYYEQYGSDSIIGFFHLLQTLSALATMPRTWLDGSSHESPRKHPATRLSSRHQPDSHGLTEG